MSSWVTRRGLGVLVLVVAAFALVRMSAASFTAADQNAGNTWSTGSATLSDDDATSAMFAATGLTPASVGSRCVKISYTGTLGAQVALYGSGSGALAPYLNLTIETGTAGAFADGDPCSGFSAAATVFSGTLGTFLASATDFGSGVPSSGRWAPTAGTRTLVYRFTYSVANDDAAQGKNCSATFTWEARTT